MPESEIKSGMGRKIRGDEKGDFEGENTTERVKDRFVVMAD